MRVKTRGKGKKPPITCKERMAFLLQRHNARKKRGISFDFTYDEWLAWWEQQLGPDWFALRGRNVGQYVMARYGDKGPYAAWNVRCSTVEQNLQEARHNRGRGNAKLTKEQVRVIYLTMEDAPRGTAVKLARRFGVDAGTIMSIKNKLTWEHVTNPLDQ